MHENQQPPLAVSEAAAGKLVGLSRSTLRQMRSRRCGPPFCRAGRRILYRVEDLIQFLASNRVETSSR
jgi:hypothetical protein